MAKATKTEQITNDQIVLDNTDLSILLSRPEIGLHKNLILWTLNNKPFRNT